MGIDLLWFVVVVDSGGGGVTMWVLKSGFITFSIITFGFVTEVVTKLLEKIQRVNSFFWENGLIYMNIRGMLQVYRIEEVLSFMVVTSL